MRVLLGMVLIISVVFAFGCSDLPPSPSPIDITNENPITINLGQPGPNAPPGTSQSNISLRLDPPAITNVEVGSNVNVRVIATNKQTGDEVNSGSISVDIANSDIIALVGIVERTVQFNMRGSGSTVVLISAREQQIQLPVQVN